MRRRNSQSGPAVRADRAASAAAADDGTGEAIEARKQKANRPLVLVVEDEDDVRDIAAMLLTDLDFDVVTAANGQEALRILASRDDIEILFTDIRMPGMSGFDLADAATKMHAGLVVILASGYFQPQTVRHKLVRKPYGRAELAHVLSATKGGSGGRQ